MIEDGFAQPLAGRQAERILLPEQRSSVVKARRRFLAVLGAVLAAHLLGLAWFLHRDEDAVPVQIAEVPVEVVQEPPPPPPQKPPPPPAEKPPPPKPPEEMEKPATSAPRAGKETPVDAAAKAAKTEAPKAAAPPRDGQPAPAPDAAPVQPSAPAAKEASAKLQDDRSDAEALEKAETETKPDDPATKAKIGVEKPSDPARQLSGLSSLPNYTFGAAAPMSDFPAGTEDNRYLAVVFAKVMRNNRYRVSAAARRGAHGVVSVSFVVDYMGRVPYQAVSESSGQADLDALAMAAVRMGAPYPPPPGSGSQQLVARMRFGPDR